jgi:hypothetical protein
MSSSKSTLCLVLHVLGVEPMLCGDFLHKYKQGCVVFHWIFYKIIGLLMHNKISYSLLREKK